MNDPRVVALTYQIDNSDGIDYSKAASLNYAGDGFPLSVADGRVRFDLEDHFSTIEAADEALTNFRAQWELSAQLDRGPETFRSKRSYVSGSRIRLAKGATPVPVESSHIRLPGSNASRTKIPVGLVLTMT